jgi:hypothetical protein
VEVSQPLDSEARMAKCQLYENNVGFGVFTAATVKNVVFWDIKPSLYLTGDTLSLRYRAQPVNVM